MWFIYLKLSTYSMRASPFHNIDPVHLIDHFRHHPWCHKQNLPQSKTLHAPPIDISYQPISACIRQKNRVEPKVKFLGIKTSTNAIVYAHTLIA